jgi:hypothetical protein
LGGALCRLVGGPESAFGSFVATDPRFTYLQKVNIDHDSGIGRANGGFIEKRQEIFPERNGVGRAISEALVTTSLG